MLTKILTVAQVAVVLFHSTGTEITMQLAKVVITNALVFVACAERVPEGTDCVLQTKKKSQTACLGCYTEVDCSMNFNALTVCTSNEWVLHLTS